MSCWLGEEREELLLHACMYTVRRDVIVLAGLLCSLLGKCQGYEYIGGHPLSLLIRVYTPSPPLA